METIKVSNLTKSFKNKVVVNDISFSIEEGKLFSLLGTNGAGKTTTIRILSTLLKKDKGSVLIDGFDLDTDAFKIKEVLNVSPQETAIANNLTVLENLNFMAGVYKIANPKEKIDYLIRMFNLEEVLNQKGKTLSGGWQRKLSIAIALINDPKVLLLDEPTLGLDVISRKQLWKIIESLKGKVTIILTTHYMEEAEKLSDSIAIMDSGEIIATGTVEEIKALTNKTSIEDAFTFLVTKGEL